MGEAGKHGKALVRKRMTTKKRIGDYRSQGFLSLYRATKKKKRTDTSAKGSPFKKYHGPNTSFAESGGKKRKERGIKGSGRHVPERRIVKYKFDRMGKRN